MTRRLFSFCILLSVSVALLGQASGSSSGAGSSVVGLAAPEHVAHSQNISVLTKAAGAGDPLAESDLAFAYAFGRGVEQSYEEAVRWFSAAAAQENAVAQFNLGALYENGLGVARDYARAFALIHSAAMHGYVPAETRLGYFFEQGWGCARIW